jgi:hypothetical protein
MKIDIFTLTIEGDYDNVFAVGMSITHPDGKQEVVTYRRDPVSGHTTLGTFDTPEGALRRCNMVVPVELEWQHDGIPHDQLIVD